MDWSALKVVELKDELKKRGLPVSGKKAELISRLEEAGDAAQEAAQQVDPAADGALAESDAPSEKPAEAQGSLQQADDADKAEVLAEVSEPVKAVAKSTGAQAELSQTEAVTSQQPAAPNKTAHQAAQQGTEQPAKPSSPHPATSGSTPPGKAAEALPTAAEPDAVPPQAADSGPAAAIPPAAAPQPASISTAPSCQAIVEHRSDDAAAPAVSSAPAQPGLGSAPSTQAVISGPSAADTAQPSRAGQPASPTTSLVAAAVQEAALAASQDAPSSASIAAPAPAAALALDAAAAAAVRAGSPAVRTPVASQAPGVGTPEPMTVEAPTKPGTASPEPAVTSPHAFPVPEAAAAAAAAIPVAAAAAAAAAVPVAAAAAAEPMIVDMPAELEEEAVDYGGFEVEPELPAPREGKQRRAETPQQAAAAVSEDVDMGGARAKRAKRVDDRTAAPSRDRKRDREGRSSKAEEAAVKHAKPSDALSAKASSSKRAPIPTYVRRESGSDAAKANGQTARQTQATEAVRATPDSVKAPAAAATAAGLTTQSSADKRVSVFAGRLGGGSADQASGEPNRAPPSRIEATRALVIEGFKRPFTDKAAVQLLSQHGTVVGMKFGPNKLKAYVIMSTLAEAEATRNALWSLDWPRDNKASLRPKFVPESEAEEFIGPDALATFANGSGAVAPAEKPVSASAPTAAPQAVQPEAGSEAAVAAAAAPALGHKPVAHQEGHVIESMFKCTTAQPKLYWQPLTDEQIQAKEAAKAAKEAAAALKDAETALAVAADGKEAGKSRERSSRHDRHK